MHANLNIREFPLHPPRKRKAVKKAIDVKFMLRPQFFCAWVFSIVGGLMFLLISTGLIAGAIRGTGGANRDILLLYALAGVEGGLAIWWLSHLRKTISRRRYILQNGVLTEGRVVDHSVRVSMAIIVKRVDTLIKVEVPHPDGHMIETQFQSPLGGLRSLFPIGSPIQAIVDPASDDVLCPAQFDVELVAVEHES
jgi:hypothetical protein